MPIEPQAAGRPILRLTRTARGVCIALAGMIVLGHFSFGATPAAVGLVPFPLDKLAHVLLYGVIAFLLSAGIGGNRPLLAFALVSLLGTADEFYQEFLPGRQGDWSDVLSDMIGALAGAFAGHALLASEERHEAA